MKFTEFQQKKEREIFEEIKNVKTVKIPLRPFKRTMVQRVLNILLNLIIFLDIFEMRFAYGPF